MTHEELKENIKKGVYEVKDNKSERDFFEDLVELFELDVKDPIVGRIWGMAWDKGHWAGYHEVYSHFHDLVEVFKGA